MLGVVQEAGEKMSDHVNNLISQAREQNSKYTYFLVSGSAASIAFAMTQTTTIALAWPNYFFLLAILCWALSVFFGIFILKYNGSEITAQINYLSEIGAVQYNQVQRALTEEKAERFGNRLAAKRVRYRKLQECLWFLGAFLYLSWKVAGAYPEFGVELVRYFAN